MMSKCILLLTIFYCIVNPILVQSRGDDPEPAPPCNFFDPYPELFPSKNCQYFWECWYGEAILFPCPEGFKFDQNLLQCEDAAIANCTGEGWSTTTSNPTTVTSTTTSTTTTTTPEPTTTPTTSTTDEPTTTPNHTTGRTTSTPPISTTSTPNRSTTRRPATTSRSGNIKNRRRIISLNEFIGID